MAFSSDTRSLIKIGDSLFDKRSTVHRLWQDIAEQFYPERAEFTTTRSIGDEFAEHLMSSFPVMVRRELGNLFSSFLRPRAPRWFELHAKDEQIDDDHDGRGWMEWASGVQWNAMYDSASKFVEAMHQSDHDFATFGNDVVSVEVGRYGDSLLHRCWHLRDCAWSLNSSNEIDNMHRRWRTSARNLVALFPGKNHQSVQEAAEKEPEKEIKCRHIVVPSDEFDIGSPKARTMPFVSIYIDEENQTELEQVPMGWFNYVVSRWSTVSGSQYGRSPATEVALPDARLLQAMTRVLLEAGEKSVDPPMVAVQEALRSDVNMMAGSLTMIDIEYDERSGEALREAQDMNRGLPFGFDMAQAVQQALQAGFFLNKLGLPELRLKEMTAYEARKVVEDHVRQSAPIFEPIEQEKNTRICNLDFEILRAHGAFGPPDMLPEILRDQEVEFTFRSPLREFDDEIKAQEFVEGLNVLKAVAEVDPSQLANANLTVATRAALRGLHWDSEWLNDEQAVAQQRQQAEEQKKVEMGVEGIGAAADAGARTGAAIKQLKEAGIA